MPTYEYVCRECKFAFEELQSMSASPLTDCPECGKPTLRRKMGTGAGMIFKGSGFYQTDYIRKNGSSEAASTKSPEKAPPSTETKSSPPPKPEASPKKTDTDSKKS